MTSKSVNEKVHPPNLNNHKALWDIDSQDSIGEVIEETFGLVGKENKEILNDGTGDHERHFKEDEVGIYAHAVNLIFFAAFYRSSFDEAV